MTQGEVIGVDLGHTNLRVALVKDGKMIDMRRSKTKSSEDWMAVAKQVVDEVQQLSKYSHAIGVGVGIAGQCSFKGVVRRGPNFWWPEAPLRQYLQDQFHLPVIVLNDTRAATFGEWKFGAGKGFDDIVCLFVGTGLGGGVVSGGNLLKGCSNTAGELGHIIVKMDGPRCGCGNRGCLESIVSGLGIAKRARDEASINSNAASLLINLAGGDASKISSDHVAIAAQKSDPLALRIVNDTAEALTVGIVSMIHAFNPKRIVIGGGVASGIPQLLDIPKKEAPKRAMGCTCEELEIVPAALGDAAGPIGAASIMAGSLEAGKREWP